MRHLRRRSGFPAVFWRFSALLLAGPECRTHADGVTGNIVFAGDSLTAGIGAAPQMSYPAQCLAILGRGWTGHNSGVSGQTGRQILEDYDAQIGRHCDRSQPLNVLVLWEATDDLASGAPPEEVAENLARICARARATGFDRVILLTSTPRSNFPGSSAIPGTPEQQRRTYNRRRDAVDARLMALYPTVDAVVPLHSDGQIGVDGAELNPVYFADDRVHLNDRGYFVVATSSPSGSGLSAPAGSSRAGPGRRPEGIITSSCKATAISSSAGRSAGLSGRPVPRGNPRPRR